MRFGAAKVKGSVEQQQERQSLEKIVKSYLNDSAEKVGLAVHLVCKYEMHSSIPMVRTCVNLVELGLLDQIGNLIGKRAPINKDKRVEYQKDLVNQMLA